MSITYDEALRTLQAMFSSWDAESISAVFASNNFHMEQTIEAILAMDNGGSGAPTSPSREQVAADEALARQLSQEGVRPVRGGAQERYAHVGTETQAQTQAPKGRGTRTILPDDFLRAPGFKSNTQLLADEQLAMMLQNELFRNMVEQELGYGWMDPSANTRPHLSRGQANSEARSSNNSGQNVTGGDMMKALQTMGEGFRRRMSDMAQRFQQRERLEDERRDAGALRPLTADLDELRDDDDSEVITFDQNVRGRHRTGYDDEEDSSNPLVNRSKKDR